MPKKKKLAIFDIDGTIFRSSLLIELTKHLVRSSIFPYRAYEELEEQKVNWLNRKGSYDAYIGKVIDVFEKNIAGVSVKSMGSATGQVLKKHKNRVYVFTRDLITRLQKTHVLLAISGSPDMAVQEFKRLWGFSFAYGTTYEQKRGVYTGNVLRVASQDKKTLLKNFCEEYGYTLAHSVGVGDTESDISFLSLVAHPIAFNPNKKLLVKARRVGWKLVVERKDVIYTL